ncbi:hypothetical protein pb186bvf_002380 [Paramecium bursaria]
MELSSVNYFILIQNIRFYVKNDNYFRIRIFPIGFQQNNQKKIKKQMKSNKLAPLNRFKLIKKLSEQKISYQLGKPIGSGSWGTVFTAQSQTGEIVACKRIPNSGLDPKDLLLKNLKHPNIVQYLGHERNKQYVFLYQELMIDSLSSFLKNFGTLDESQIKKFAIDILNGLEYLHKNRILHLDLKSSNILIDIKGHAKIADFGCSRQLQASSLQQSCIMGSVLWMAPEMINQEKLTSATDIWSFGCLILEMIKGKVWDQDFDNPISAILQISEGAQPQIPKSCSAKLQEFIKSCFCEPRASISQLKSHPFLK